MIVIQKETNNMKCIVTLIWHDGVWLSDVNTSDGEPVRLTLESGSCDVLMERVRYALPEMLELNFDYTGDAEVLFEIKRIDTLRGVVTA